MTLQFEGVGFNTGTGAGGKIGTVVLVANGSQPSTPYTVGSKWFYNGKIYTATTTTAHDSGVVPSYDTAYLYNGTYYYWDGSTLQGADESNLVHISGTETITGDKTFSGKSDFQGETTAVTQATSDTSQKVATTKFVKDFAEDGEWQKPSDWVDIRNGALDNSVYYLVAHSKPVLADGVYTVENYPKFAVRGISTGSTYDVYVDGIKIATTNNDVTTTIDWGALYTAGTIKSGYDISEPGAGNYTTHIVRVTPTVLTDKLTKSRLVAIDGQQYQGLLWAHIETSEVFDITIFIGGANTRCTICQAITAKNDKIKYHVASSGSTGLYSCFAYASALKKVPILEAETNERAGSGYISFVNVPAKITIKNNSEELNFNMFHSYKGTAIETENPLKLETGTAANYLANGIYNLKKIPKISTTNKGTIFLCSGAYIIEPTFIDDSFNDQRTLFKFVGGSDSSHIANLVGLVVSSSAPFNYETAPQLSVRYTNMNRDALVRLFNSLPTVSDSQEIEITGAIGATDLTAEDLAIATGKGWTVTR